MNAATERMHDAATEHQAHAGPLAVMLGGKERIEDAAKHLRRNAGRVVTHLQHIGIALTPGGNLDLPLSGDLDGVQGVLDEIEQHIHQQRI